MFSPNIQHMKRLIVPVILLAVFFCSCKQSARFSIIPKIEFVDLEKIANNYNYDDKANLTFYFQDGDGDIGLEGNISPSDTLPEQKYNLFINYYEKQNGQFVKIDSINNNARIPYLSNNVPESIEGEITYEIYINNYLSPYDTVYFDFYIVDRALHRSNTVRTPEIIIKKR